MLVTVYRVSLSCEHFPDWKVAVEVKVVGNGKVAVEGARGVDPHAGFVGEGERVRERVCVREREREKE